MRFIKSARSAESCAFLVSFLSCLRAMSQKIVYVIRFFRQNARRTAPAMTVAEYFFVRFYRMFIFNITQQKARDEKSCAFCDYRIFKK